MQPSRICSGGACQFVLYCAKLIAGMPFGSSFSGERMSWLRESVSIRSACDENRK